MLPAAVAVLSASLVAAQQTPPRAWQQRLETEIPAPVPVVALEAANPFATEVDTTPRRRSAVAPSKVDTQGRAVAAAYVDARGECRGAVPLEVPYPGVAGPLMAELKAAKFDPAFAGADPTPSWAVVSVVVEGRVREAEIVSETLELPRADDPPREAVRAPATVPASLASLPATPNDRLTRPAELRRLRLRVPSGDAEVPVRALIHVTSDGRADRFVPLDLEPGLNDWMAAYLATWALEPATREGDAVDCWVLYSARARVHMGALTSSTFRVEAGQSFDPTVPG